MSHLARAGALYRKHKRWVPIAFFLLGFLFDAVMLKRIDEPSVLIQQAVYISVSSILIGIELIEESREVHPPAFLKKVWRFRESLLDFLLGTLLNSYTIFYFKSASALTSFCFIALMVALLTLNEFKNFGKSQTQVHVALLSLCLISYSNCLAPIGLGFIGPIAFLCAAAGAASVFYAYYRIIKPKMAARPRLVTTHLVYPSLAIQIGFVVLYFAHIIPPVPLSVKFMGIYHGVTKTERGYELTSYRSGWSFWQHGDQSFLARPGDTIYCYAQIFSPTRFKDRLQVRWLYKDGNRGWSQSDAIPLPVHGGRDEGFRAFTTKANFVPGSWRVQIETMENQQIGSIDFDVAADDSSSEREARIEIR